MLDWDIITDTIKENKCVLFIGPEVLSHANGTPFTKKLTEYLDIDNNPSIRKYYPDVELFLFESGKEKTRTYYKIKKFYKQASEKTEALYAKIAEIPFHLIISINPDHKLPDAFDKLGRRYKFDYYWKKKTGDQPKQLTTSNMPVIYNMLGSINEQESMILSYDDLFDYFNSIANDVIPADIRLKVKEASNLIFLGFDFEKWYMQLLLRFLYSKHDQYRFMQFASNASMKEQTKTFCVDQFEIEFVPNDSYEFIDQLYEACRKEAILKSAETDVLQQVKEMIESNKLREAIPILKSYLEELGERAKELLHDLTLMMGRQKDLQKRERMGTISEEEIMTLNARLRANFLDLVAHARDIE